MRQIKFRLWCENKQEWESDAWVITSKGLLYNPLNQRTMRRETHILEQYTGLKDKNGKEIYDGDICELEVVFNGITTDDFEEASYYNRYTGVVRFMPSKGFHLKVFKGFDMDDEVPLKDIPKYKDIVQYRSKVIGNIHENK